MTEQQNAQNGRHQRGDESAPPDHGCAGLAVHALRATPKDETGKCHQECRERQISNDRDGAKNLHETPFACLYRPALARPTFDAQGQAALGRTLLAVARRQNLHQRRQASAQVRDTMGNQVGHAVGVVRTGPDAVRQVDRMIVHLPEPVANQGTRVLGMKRAVQLQGAQQLLPDRVVVRMAPGAQACLVQRLGPPVKSAKQLPPIGNIMLRGFTTSSDAAAVER